MTPLHEQLAAAERELASLDFDGARERVRHAEAEARTYPIGGVWHVAGDAEQQAQGRRKQARDALASMERRADELRREVAGISRLLNADKRVEQAKAGVHRAQQAADASAGSLADAEAVVARLSVAIDGETREAAAVVEAAAAEMLEAARTGADAASVQVRPDRLAPLQAALAGAERERRAARRKHEADKAAVVEAVRLVRECEADASEAAYLTAQSAFVTAAAQHVAAMTRAGRPAPAFTGLHGLVMQAAQAIESAAP
ncbi:MAG TPA: hypothetical protein PKC97_11600 [Burkholderiaceae bacterium]|nr:hypothetical protein [Burkholderiaceae bacterium]